LGGKRSGRCGGLPGLTKRYPEADGAIHVVHRTLPVRVFTVGCEKRSASHRNG
jgi:hypothetical protein